MTTLRRDLRKKFEEILIPALSDSPQTQEAIDYATGLAEKCADAALELRGFSLLQNAGLDWSILAGQDITEESVKQIQLRDLAPKLFERALGFSKPLPWWDGDKEWKALGEWVVERYEESKTSFGEYNIWRNTQYVKGGLANTTIRSFPKKFYDSWDMFMMSKQPKTDDTKGEYIPRISA